MISVTVSHFEYKLREECYRSNILPNRWQHPPANLVTETTNGVWWSKCLIYFYKATKDHKSCPQYHLPKVFINNFSCNFYTKIVDVSRIRTRIVGLDGYHANHLTTTTTTTKTTQTCKNFIEFLPRWNGKVPGRPASVSVHQPTNQQLIKTFCHFVWRNPEMVFDPEHSDRQL